MLNMYITIYIHIQITLNQPKSQHALLHPSQKVNLQMERLRQVFVAKIPSCWIKLLAGLVFP
jgi:hypothetical protein